MQVYTVTMFLYDVVVPDTSWLQHDRLRAIIAHVGEIMHVPSIVLSWTDNNMMHANFFDDKGH